MARVNSYLNFVNQTEEAFNFYRSVFGGEFVGGIGRFSDVPADPTRPPLAPEDKNLIMHIDLEITGGHHLMGTDAPKSMGFQVTQGNNVHLSIEPDTRAEAERLYQALSDGGKIKMPLQEMFWGAYYAGFSDKFGINWMINCTAK